MDNHQKFKAYHCLAHKSYHLHMTIQPFHPRVFKSSVIICSYTSFFVLKALRFDFVCEIINLYHKIQPYNTDTS